MLADTEADSMRSDAAEDRARRARRHHHTVQAQIIAYIDDFKLQMVATLPLLIVFKKPSRGGADHTLGVE
jgi:hypothetical protein